MKYAVWRIHARELIFFLLSFEKLNNITYMCLVHLRIFTHYCNSVFITPVSWITKKWEMMNQTNLDSLFRRYFTFYLTTYDNWGKLFCFTIENKYIINYPINLFYVPKSWRLTWKQLQHQSLNICFVRWKTNVFQ